jgi:nucleotide-binding universal stress UspA family protein
MKKVLIAYDGSESAKRALQMAVDLLHRGEVEVSILAVAEGLPLYGYAGTLPSAEQENERQAQLTEAAKALAEHGMASTLVKRSGDPATAILDEAQKEGIDVIVMGTRGLSTADRWLLGSVSTKVLHHASCSVLVAR